MPLFLALFLVVRGVPALLLYRGVLDGRDRAGARLLLGDQLPLVVAITTLAVRDGHMRSANAAALVGAAILSTLVLPARRPAAAARPRGAGAGGAGYSPGRGNCVRHEAVPHAVAEERALAEEHARARRDAVAGLGVAAVERLLDDLGDVVGLAAEDFIGPFS